jgi:hypothetical protein
MNPPVADEDPGSRGPGCLGPAAIVQDQFDSEEFGHPHGFGLWLQTRKALTAKPIRNPLAKFKLLMTQ